MTKRNEFFERVNWLSGAQSEAEELFPTRHERMPAAYWILRVWGVLAVVMLIGLHLLILAGPTDDAERPDLIMPMWRRLADASVVGIVGAAAVAPRSWTGTGFVFIVRVALLTLSGLWYVAGWWGGLQGGSPRPLVLFLGVVALGLFAAACTALWCRSSRTAVPDSVLPN